MNPYNIQADCSWTKKQQKRFKDLAALPDVTLAYWCSDLKGLPCNGGSTRITPAAPGVIHKGRKNFHPCTKGAIHATKHPHLWDGERVWVVALTGAHEKISVDDSKLASSEREIIGEITKTDQLSILPRLYRNKPDREILNVKFQNQKVNNFSVVNLSLTNCSFKEVTMNNSHIENVNYNNCDFVNCNLSDSTFEKCIFVSCNLTQSNINDEYTENCLFIDCELPKKFKKSRACDSAFIRSK